ncbi:SGNH/GDSL hydrolase family protein [Rosistilla oblonga]|uniref:SGNH/GDSL hydrolase family protein n=1 Tax=Rosistilla oblonga TaxID=2527990 RepID=UPI003A976010
MYPINKASKHIARAGSWRVCRARGIAFRLIALAIGLLPLLMIESTLWVLDFPRAESRIEAIGEANGTRRLFVLNRATGRYEIAPDRLNLFRPDSFVAEKPADLRRVFVLGGSTVQGRPYQIETAFSTWLGLALQTCDPRHRWEVVNCGGVSYASYRVAAILDEVLQYQPDAIILYIGHNEFLERQSFGQLQRLPDWLVPSLSAVERMRTFQLLRSQIFADAALEPSTRELLTHNVDALLDNQGGLAEYHPDAPPRGAVEEAFADNLDAMIAYCRQRNVPVIVCCPARNLADCPPFKSEPLVPLDDSDQRAFDAAMATATDEQAAAADRIAALRAAQAIDPQNPSVAYRLGRLMLQAGEIETARQQLTLAADNDSCPLRIRSSMQSQIRAIAAQRQVPLLDVDRLMQSHSRNGLVGAKWMVDHVHPTVHGHQMIADALWEIFVDQRLTTSDVDCQSNREAAYADHLRSLDESYFVRGQQRLEGLKQWAAGRAR